MEKQGTQDQYIQWNYKNEDKFLHFCAVSFFFFVQFQQSKWKQTIRLSITKFTFDFDETEIP